MVIHAVVWPMSRSIIDGFNAVPELYLEVGRNIGLSPVKLIFGVFLPADQELNEIPFFQQCLMGICETAASKLYEVLVILAEAEL